MFDGLRAKGRFSISKSTDRGEVFKSPNASDYAETASTERGSYRETRDENLSYDGDLNVTYAKLFNEVHMVNAVGEFVWLRANHNPVVTSLSGLSMTVIQILLFLQGILRR